MKEKAERSTIIVRCSPELKLAIEMAAKAENRSITNFVETILMEKMAESGLSSFSVMTTRMMGTKPKPYPAPTSPPPAPVPVIGESSSSSTDNVTTPAESTLSSIESTLGFHVDPPKSSDSDSGFSVKLPSFLESSTFSPTPTPPASPSPPPMPSRQMPTFGEDFSKKQEQEPEPPANPLQRMRHNF